MSQFNNYSSNADLQGKVQKGLPFKRESAREIKISIKTRFQANVNEEEMLIRNSIDTELGSKRSMKEDSDYDLRQNIDAMN